MKFSLPNILAFFESIDAWVMKHPRGSTAIAWCIGMVLGAYL